MKMPQWNLEKKELVSSKKQRTISSLLTKISSKF